MHSNVEKIVIKAYCWLADNHSEGDQIFLFGNWTSYRDVFITNTYFIGFSRGAYQVRVLSAMIHKVTSPYQSAASQSTDVHDQVGLIPKSDEEGAWRFVPFGYALPFGGLTLSIVPTNLMLIPARTARNLVALRNSRKVSPARKSRCILWVLGA